MEWEGLSRALLALLIVSGLIWLTSYLLRRFGLEKRLSRLGGGKSTMALQESFYLDPKRRIVVVSREKKRYVLLLGATQDIVLDQYEDAEETTGAV